MVGRIASIRNRAHEEFHDEATGFFGFFESENDPGIGFELHGELDVLADDPREQVLDAVHGSVGLTRCSWTAAVSWIRPCSPTYV